MVDYIPIDDSEVEPEAPLISSLGVRWRDNPLAIAEGAPGAPRVVSAGIDWSSVSGEIGQSQLKTTTGSQSVSASGTPSSESSNITLPGGSFSFYPRLSYSGTRNPSGSGSGDLIFELNMKVEDTVSATLGNPESVNQGAANRVFLSVEVTESSGTGDATATAENRYIQSSPPYDHGDGDVSGYIYSSIKESGRISEMYIAEDPPWYGNTQNAPIDQWRDPETGKEYQRIRKLKCSKRDVDEGRMSFAEFMERAGECEDLVEEITPETKLRGMDELPHPFEEREGRTIVLLDPMDEKISRLIRMMQAGENVHELFNDGYLIVENEPCKRAGPPGVPVHEIKWRKT